MNDATNSMLARTDREQGSIPLISLVVPVFNEGQIARANLAAILKAAAGDWYTLELIAVDDGSVDNTADEIAQAAQQDERIRPISFTRNFGKEAAILAGLAHAQGDAAIVLDGDLQHPPQLIPDMLALWRQGLYVVEAVKQDRGDETLSQGLLASTFYGVFQRFANLDLRGHSDFKLLDREVIDAYLALPERHRFFRAMIGWAHYPSAQIPFDVAERNGGQTHWGKLSLLRYAINNITSFSSLPLKLVSYLGLVTLIFGGVIGVTSLVQKFNGKALDGFTTVNLLIVVMGSAILLSLGIIGHYLARLYDEIKGRPPYVIKPPKRAPRK